MHILSAESGWLDRCGGPKRGARLNPADFPTLDSIVELWNKVEAQVRAFLAGLSDADCAGTPSTRRSARTSRCRSASSCSTRPPTASTTAARSCCCYGCSAMHRATSTCSSTSPRNTAFQPGRPGAEGDAVVFTKSLREGVRRGRIKCSVRIWTRPHVKPGGRYPMDDGHVVVDSNRGDTAEGHYLRSRARVRLRERESAARDRQARPRPARLSDSAFITCRRVAGKGGDTEICNLWFFQSGSSSRDGSGSQKLAATAMM